MPPSLRRSESFSLTSFTRKRIPLVPFQKLKEEILGKEYSLSLVLVGERRAQSLNKKYRKKTYSPNVLSFPLSKTEGEIFLSPQRARKEMHRFGMNFETYLAFLVIHALLHLKGHAHGRTMEKKEREVLKKFYP